jgi:hypothetical protein
MANRFYTSQLLETKATKYTNLARKTIERVTSGERSRGVGRVGGSDGGSSSDRRRPRVRSPGDGGLVVSPDPAPILAADLHTSSMPPAEAICVLLRLPAVFILEPTDHARCQPRGCGDARPGGQPPWQECVVFRRSRRRGSHRTMLHTRILSSES